MSALPARDEMPAPSPAVAPPPGNPRFPLFDSVRAIAVLAVLVYHVAAETGALNNGVSGDIMAVAGAKALSLLFLTSGFLLYRPFVRARAAGRPLPSPRRYLRRRMLRILPAYWFALTLLAVYPGIVGVFGHDWWRYYFFLQIYSAHTLNGGIPPAWTLCVEMSFYLTLPVWAWLVRRVPVRRGPDGWYVSEMACIAALAALGIAVQIARSRLRVSQILATTILGNCLWIALGMGLATTSVWVVARRREPRAIRALGEHPGIAWLIAAGCLGACTAILHPGGLLGILRSLNVRQPYARTLSDIALTMVMCVLVASPTVFGQTEQGLVRRVLGWRPLMWVGLVAYGVYLWQLPVVWLLTDHHNPTFYSATGLGLGTRLHVATTPILLLLTLAGTFMLAAGSYYGVELPFLRRKER